MINKRPTDSVQAMERVERDQNSAAVRQKRLSKLRRRVRSSIASGSALPAALDRFGPHWNQLEIVLISATWIEQTRIDRYRLAASRVGACRSLTLGRGNGEADVCERGAMLRVP